MSTEPNSRPARIDAAALVLAATHVFIIYTAIESGWRLETVTWLYWYGSLIFFATVLGRMLCMDDWNVFGYFVFFGVLQTVAYVFTYAGAGVHRWDRDTGLALLGIFVSQLLEMRAARAIDREDPPFDIHFLMLGLVRLIPLALMVAFAIALGDWIAEGPFTYLMVFLLSAATVDVAMQVRGRTIGRVSARL